MAAKKTTQKKAKPTKKQRSSSAPSSSPSSSPSTSQQPHEQPAPGEPPAGKLDAAAVDRVVAAWRKRPVRDRADYADGAGAELLKFSANLDVGRADLADFKAIGAPITVRHFDWMRLVRAAYVEAEFVSAVDIARAFKRAVADVVSAHTVVARIAAASGVPRALFTLPASSAPASLLPRAEALHRQLLRQLWLFHDADVARAALDAFAAAVAGLREVVCVDEDNRADTIVVDARRAALARVLADVVRNIALWGRAAVGDDPSRRARYALKALRR